MCVCVSSQKSRIDFKPRRNGRALTNAKGWQFRINHLSKWIHGKQSSRLNQVQLHKNGIKDDTAVWKMMRHRTERGTKQRTSYNNRTQFRRKMHYLLLTLQFSFWNGIHLKVALCFSHFLHLTCSSSIHLARWQHVCWACRHGNATRMRRCARWKGNENVYIVQFPSSKMGSSTKPYRIVSRCTGISGRVYVGVEHHSIDANKYLQTVILLYFIQFW